MCTVRRDLQRKAATVRRAQMRNERVGDFRRQLQPVLEQELSAARGALDRAFSTRAVSGFREWIEDFYPEQAERIASDLRPLVEEYGEAVIRAALEEMGASVGVDGDRFARLYSEGLATRWTTDSVAQLRQILRDEDEPEQAVRERLEKWEEVRVDRTAQQEATQTGGAFAKHAFLLAGASLLVWRAVGESCPLCRRMDGRTVGVDRPFLGEGQALSVPDDDVSDLVPNRNIGHPPLHGMGGKGGICDCIVGAA